MVKSRLEPAPPAAAEAAGQVEDLLAPSAAEVWSTAGYRRLAEDLRQLAGERLREERELVAFQAGDEVPPHRLQESLRGLADAFEQEASAVEARAAAERQAAEERHRAETAAAERDFERSSAEIRQRFAGQTAELERVYEENCWMLSSLLDDDSEENPKRRYEALRDQLRQTQDHLTASWEDVKASHARATELVGERRQSTAAETEPPPPARNRQEAAVAFESAARIVESCHARLRRQILPRLFAGWTVVSLTVLAWGTIFAVAYFTLDYQKLGLRATEPSAPALISAGGSLGVTVAVVGLLWCVAARLTAKVYGPLCQATAVAQANYQQWLRFAKEETRRHERDFQNRYQEIVEHRDRSFRRFAADRERQSAELAANREQELRGPVLRRDAALREAAERLEQEIRASEAAARRGTADLHSRLELERSRLTRGYEADAASRASETEARVRRIANAWAAAKDRARWLAESSGEASRRAFPEWADIAVKSWAPAEQIPDGVRIGDLRLAIAVADTCSPDPRLADRQIAVDLPAVLPFPASPSLLLEAPPAGRSDAVSILQVASLRLLTLLPPGKVRFTFVDPVGLGESFSAFMHLVDFDDLLVSGRVWTEPAEIEQRLADLTGHMESVFQKYLRNEFESLEEYNVHAGEVAEPYRILVVANFPAGFTDRAAQRLESIVASGPKCGVYTLLSCDPRQPMPRGFDPSAAQIANRFRWEDGRFVADDLGPEPVALDADAPPPPGLFASVVRRVGELSKDVRRVEVPFRRIVPPADDWWTADSRRTIDCPLGRAGAMKLQHMRLGLGTSQHVLVAGKTGSGKSTLLHVLITNLALRYSPDEVEFYMIDFKKGVEFKTYAAQGLPHARVIAIESDREFGTSVLERLDAVLRARGDLFREAGVQDIESFRDAEPGVPMPRILLVVDEFQEFFTEDDKYAQTASLLLDRLVRQGRAFGIHVLLGSQTLGGAYSLARATIGQMAVRVALQCSEADAHLILSEDNTAARRLNRPGEAIYNDANGLTEGNSPFQVAWLGDDERDEYLVRIRELAARRGLPPAAPVVFEGNVAPDPARNTALVRRIEAAASGRIEPVPGAVPSAWIGDAVAITGPATVAFPARPGANLLVVGQDAAAGGILAACLVSLATESGGGDGRPSFHMFAADANRTELWKRILSPLPGEARFVTDEAASAMAELAAEVKRRSESREKSAPVFLLIDGLGRFRELRRSDDDFGFGGFDRERVASPSKMLAEVLREGPGVGVHAVVWCDSYNTADRWLGRSMLKEFGTRVALPMSAADSSNLIDSPAAGRLGASRAILYGDEQGTTEKFRPYRLPSEDWLNWLRERFEPADGGPDDPEELNIDEWVIV